VPVSFAVWVKLDESEAKVAVVLTQYTVCSTDAGTKFGRKLQRKRENASYSMNCVT